MFNFSSYDENKHFFDKIRTSYLITEIFTFLNLSNVRVLTYVNKRFRNHLFKNDSQQLRIVGHYTYGLDKQKPFECNPRAVTNLKPIKSNMFPIEHMCLLNDLDLIASSSGTYEYGLTFWGQESGFY